MEKTRLWEALVTLSRSELRAFDKFVRSPFFNQKEALVRLFSYLRQCRETEQPPEAHSAFAAAYPRLPYDDQKLRLANSDLLFLLEHYLMYEESFADFERNKVYLARAYRKRHLPKHNQTALREVRLSRESRRWRHAEYFEDLHRIELEAFQLASAAKRYEAFNLQEISDLLDKTYAAQKLRHVCFALSHQAVTRMPYHFGLLQHVLAHVEHQNWLDVPAIALYYHAYHFLANPSAEEHFTRFRTMLHGSAEQFPTDELRALYLLALNFSIKKSNDTGQADWYRTTLGLYQEALERDLLLENSMLSRFAYHNIVGVAVRLGEVDWAERFIHQYRPLLEENYREATFSLNMARVAYMRGAYGDALLYLQRADYKDFINGMNAKILQLKIYYESQGYDLLESHLDSIQHYVRRQRAVGYHRDNYLNIARCTRTLMRLPPGDTGAMDDLRCQIVAEQVLTEKEWLLEQLLLKMEG